MINTDYNKGGGDVNISKYLELLRFYVTEKIGEVDASLKNTVSSEVRSIISSLLSALFSLFISIEFIQTNGIGGVILKIVTVIILFVVFNFLISKLLRYIKSYRETKQADNKDLSSVEIKSYVDKFDHIACDGVLLARDFLNKSKDNSLTTNERQFSLIEAFYYYKKSLDATLLIVNHSTLCVNNPNNNKGISLYRLINIFYLLEELNKDISDNIKVCKIAQLQELENEFNQYSDKLNIIKNFIQSDM